MKVGELHALLRLDDAQFNRGLDQSGRRFSAFGDLVRKGAQALSTVFTAAVGATTALGVSAVKVGLDYNRMQQSSRAALTTLLGSAEAANAQMDKLDEFATTSPFAKDVFIRAQQQLIGFGREAEQVIPILDAVQNAVAATGGSNQDISELVTIIAQIGATGKITAEHLNQFGYRGVDAATIIGEAMGKTGAQIREDITSGALDAEDAIVALTDGMMARFGGATDRIKEQFDGAADRVKAAFRDIGSILAEPFIDPNGGGYAVVWFNDVADAMRAFQAQLEPLTGVLVQRFTPALDRISPAIQSVKTSIDGWDLTRVNAQLDVLTGYTPLIAGVSTALLTMGLRTVPVLGAFTGAISPATAGLAAMVATSPELRAALGNILSALEPLIPDVVMLGGALMDLAMHAMTTLGPALGDLGVAAAEAGVGLGGSLLEGATALAVAAVPLVDVLADLVGWVADLPTPLLTAGAAFLALRSPITQTATAMSGPLRTAFTNARDYMAASQAIAQETGGKISAMGAAAGAAGAGVRGLAGALRAAFLTNAVGLAITGVVAALAAVAARSAETRANADELRRTLDEQTGAWTANTEEIIANRLETEGTAAAYQKIGGNTRDLVEHLRGNADATERVKDVLAAARSEAEASADTWGDYGYAVGTAKTDSAQFGDAIHKVEGDLDTMGRELDQAVDANRRYAEMTGRSASAADQAADAVRDYTDQLRAAIDAQREAAGEVLNLNEAQRRLQESVLAVDEAVERNGATLDGATSAGIENQRVLDNIARSAWDLQASMHDASASEEDLRAAMRTSRDALIEAAEKFGMTTEEARAYADTLGLIPDNVTTDIQANPQPASEVLAATLAAIANSEESVTIDGQDVPVMVVLDAVRRSIVNTNEQVTIDGNDYPAGRVLDAVAHAIRNKHEYVTIDGNRYRADDVTRQLLSWISQRNANVNIGANTWQAYRDFNSLINSISGRTVRVPVVMQRMGQAAMSGGGWVTPGLDAGGWVPGRYPGEGIDNVLWPLHAGGKTLTQPLAGEEFVVKATQARKHAALLEAINDGRFKGLADGGRVFPVTATTPRAIADRPMVAGLSPADRALLTELVSASRGGVHVGTINTSANPREIVEELAWEQRKAPLG